MGWLKLTYLAGVLEQFVDGRRDFLQDALEVGVGDRGRLRSSAFGQQDLDFGHGLAVFVDAPFDESVARRAFPAGTRRRTLSTRGGAPLTLPKAEHVLGAAIASLADHAVETRTLPQLVALGRCAACFNRGGGRVKSE